MSCDVGEETERLNEQSGKYVMGCAGPPHPPSSYIARSCTGCCVLRLGVESSKILRFSSDPISSAFEDETNNLTTMLQAVNSSHSATLLVFAT